MSGGNPHNLVAGQELYFVPGIRRTAAPYTVTVKSVGRKWAKLEGYLGRISLETLEVDGGDYSSPGKCWVSAALYEKTAARRKAWDALRAHIREAYSPPENITTRQIDEVLRLLGGDR